MSSSTWTPPAVASEAAPCSLALWRAVEAQHQIATRALVDTQAEHELLEALLERAKPPVPVSAAPLDYLLYTPFRYAAPPPAGSRFRSLDDPGVWYGAESVRTSCAELGYWRWRFVRDSSGLARLDAVAHTVFQASATGSCIDLRSPPFVADAQQWTDPDHYGACQALARIARRADIDVIRYQSVRDPERGGCGAVLAPMAFAGGGHLRGRQTWFLTVDGERAAWVRTGTRRDEKYEFVYGLKPG